MTDESKPFAEINGHASQFVLGTRWFLIICMMLLYALHLQAQDKLCFPSTVWFGGVSGPNLSVTSGAVNYFNDPGWSGSFRYVYGNGTTTPFVVVQGIRDSSNNLFLSFEGEALPSLTDLLAPTSVVVVAFDFRSTGGGLYRIVISPVSHVPGIIPTAPPGTVSTSVGPRSLSTGTVDAAGQVTWPNQLPQPTWLLNANTSYWGVPGNYEWFLAFEIPSTALSPTAAPLPANFKLYFNTFRTVNGQYEESWWPQESTLFEPGCDPSSMNQASCHPEGATPPPSLWGTATIGPPSGCGGVSVGSQNNDIHTNNTPNSKICLIPGATASDGTMCPSSPNVFTANVHNSLVNSSGQPQPESNVRATFSIANFGLQSPWDPTQWTKVNVAQNPTTATTLTSAITPLSTASWFPVQPNAALYSTTNGAHQCIRVQLDSTSGNVDLLNNAAIQNMDVVHASNFKRNAEISGKGYDLRPDKPDGTHNNDQVFDLHVLTKEEILQPGQATGGTSTASQTGNGKNPKRRQVTSQLTWIAHGCRHTGRYMFEQEHKIEICDPVGGFGYNIQHTGNAQVVNWHIKFKGNALEAVPGQPDTYRVHVPQGGVVEVTTEGNPQEKGSTEAGRLAAFVDAGAAVPHGTFHDAYDAGFSLNAGLEYIASSHFSAEAIFGTHRFGAKDGKELIVYQFSVNGKAYFTAGGTLRPFVAAGIGAYKFSPGTSEFGGNIGVGVLKEFSSHLGLEASYNLHVVGTSNSSAVYNLGTVTKFSTIQAGIRFVF